MLHIETGNLKAILFDSGRVLNAPRTGHWFIPPNFFNYVDKSKYELIKPCNIESAFNKALQSLNAQQFILDETKEFEHFIEFYRTFSYELPSLELDQAHVMEIARDTVYNDEKFCFYEDVSEIIPKLSRRFKLGIVSDTWPSLERVFRNAGLRNYFSTFIMSSVLGVIKPDKLMFSAALSELDIKREEVIFIDDNIKNVEGANKLGIQSILMMRDQGYKSNSKHLVITGLEDLVTILEEL